jgi:hypothetical protein
VGVGVDVGVGLGVGVGVNACSSPCMGIIVLASLSCVWVRVWGYDYAGPELLLDVL